MTYRVEPTRKPDCRHYSQCLDQAAYSNADLGCTRCEKYEPEVQQPDQQELAGCRALAAMIFSDNDTPIDDLLNYYFGQADAMAELDLPVHPEARKAFDAG